MLVDYVRRRHIRVEVEVERSGTEAPVANGRYSVIESFNGSLRDELLNEELFDSLADARRKLAIWRYDSNNVRPHSSLGNRTPAQARRAFEQDESITPDALVQAHGPSYVTARLSL